MPDTSSTSGALVGNVSSLIGQASSDTKRNTGSALDKDAFLKLLVTQLQNQDPSKPMDNTQFISQMAQFSSLEQMQNLNDTLTSQQQVQTLSNASNMIGKYVSLLDTSGSSSAVVNGQVSEVRMAGDKVSVVIGGKDYDATAITLVSPTAISAADAQAAADAQQAAAAAKSAKTAASGTSTTSGSSTSTNSAATSAAAAANAALAAQTASSAAAASAGSSAAASALGNATSAYKLQSLLR